jgi:hypothetical protein
MATILVTGDVKQAGVLAAFAALAVMLAASGANAQERAPTKEDCAAHDQDVHVVATMRQVTWVRRIEHKPEGSLDGTFVRLVYELNLDPDAGAAQRLYEGLSQHGRLFITFGRQFRHPGIRPAGPLRAEVRAGDRVATFDLDENATIVLDGSLLADLLQSEGDIRVLVFDEDETMLRDDRLWRTQLAEVDGAIRRTIVTLQERLRDPAAHCPVEEIVPAQALGRTLE